MRIVPIKYSPHLKTAKFSTHFLKLKMRKCHLRSQLSGNVLKLFNLMQAKFAD